MHIGMHACIYIYMLCMKECMYMMQLYCSLAWGARWKLCGEAYRAGQVDMLGINVQRSWIVLLVFFLLRIANLHICNANPEIHWSRRSNSWACWNIHTANDSSTGLACYQFPMSKVPQSKVRVLVWIGFSTLITIHIAMLWLFIWCSCGLQH